MELIDHIRTPKKAALTGSFLLGVFILMVAAYSLVVEIAFVQKATTRDGRIVEVRHELVPKGKGSVMAYVPVVEVADGANSPVRVAVETYDEEPVYKIGEQLNTLCDASIKCIPNTFWDKWGDSMITFLLSCVFLAIPMLINSRR